MTYLVSLLKSSSDTPHKTCRPTGQPWQNCKQSEQLWGQQVFCLSSDEGRPRPHKGKPGRWSTQGQGSRPAATGLSFCLEHERALCQGLIIYKCINILQDTTLTGFLPWFPQNTALNEDSFCCSLQRKSQFVCRFVNINQMLIQKKHF